MGSVLQQVGRLDRVHRLGRLDGGGGVGRVGEEPVALTVTAGRDVGGTDIAHDVGILHSDTGAAEPVEERLVVCVLVHLRYVPRIPAGKPRGAAVGASSGSRPGTPSGRRNIRSFADRPIASEHLDRILEAGWRAPSSINRQPWDFVVVTDQDLARRLLRFPADRFLAYMLSLGYPADRPLRPIERPRRRPFEEVVHRGVW